ncbi:MAG: hypothetical protein EB167_04230 [Nitrososphaeria archaeon]|nr:hypothetical protein [Nitrososphaeria archaeon]
MDLEKFQDDVYTITNKLGKSLDENDIPKLNFVRQRLIELYQQNLVKINHSVLELICAANLVSKGFSVDVEKPLTGSLVCDLYGKKDGKTAIIEIETGFTPPEHALDTIDYYTLDSVYLINIDKGFAKEVNPASYYSLTSSILEKSEIDL